ncbi:MAG TPA: hypothetical protein PK156_29220 [Polyangium sp.]|nr:hypothetical protein [Polyangium sp.]
MNIESLRQPSAVTFTCFASLAAVVLGMALEPGQSVAAGRESVVETNQIAALTAKAETESYVAEIKPVGTYTPGKEGVVEIVLTAKAPYHINTAYSHKFVTPDPAPAGVTYPKTLLAKADGKFTESTATFQLPFVVSKAGKYGIGGRLSLSVCSSANCVMEKLDLEVDVEAK